MALIIDERVAGGRPKKGSRAPLGVAGSIDRGAIKAVRMPRIVPPLRTASVLAWARV